ncbi:MAG: hypothetical protein CL949_10115 [Erythrobacter sp.]|nr:hypothetical protein [Erythrobacter sp.]
MKTFVELVTAGHLHPDQIDDWIDEWHSSAGLMAPMSAAEYEAARQQTRDASPTLEESLGFTVEEYSLWVKDPLKLTEILERHGASTDLELGKLTVRHGVCGDEQESSFMNATLVTERGTAVSFAISPPDNFITDNAPRFNEAILETFGDLLAKGWAIEVQRGADEEVSLDNIL